MMSKCHDQGEEAVFNDILISRNSFSPLYSFKYKFNCNKANFSLAMMAIIKLWA